MKAANPQQLLMQSANVEALWIMKVRIHQCNVCGALLDIAF